MYISLTPRKWLSTLSGCGLLTLSQLTWANPVCVYNQAYQENYQADSIQQIIDDASGCYALIDPFDDDTYQQIDAVKHANAGNQVGCYISAGTGENWRDDFDELKPFLVEKQWGDWEGEYFIDRVDTGVIDVMKRRLDKMAQWGCDWVEFDNMDWATDDEYRDNYGFAVTWEESEHYNRELCDYTHALGMKCMAKNTRDVGGEMYDGVTFESYHSERNWWDDEHLQGFIDEDKLSIIVHYNERRCNRVYKKYKARYDNGDQISYICERRKIRAYKHYNEN
jgi:hypothetical protein